MDKREKVRENRLRRMAERQGLALSKSRRRDPRALDFGAYMLTDTETNVLVSPSAPWGAYTLTLDEVEEWLTNDQRQDEVEG